jgi:hypothetical protein
MSLDEANGAALLDDQQHESQLQNPGQIPPQQSRGMRSLFFSGSPAEEPEPWTPGTEAGSTQPSGDGSDSDADWQSDPDESPEATGQPASSADGGGPLKPLGKAALKATSRKGVLIATSAVHRIAARHELEQAAGLYIADEQDQELIGDPVANLLHRRGGIVGGQMSEDANDAISALMGLANYIGKQVALTVEIGRLKEAGVTVPRTVDGQVG